MRPQPESPWELLVVYNPPIKGVKYLFADHSNSRKEIRNPNIEIRNKF